MYYLGMDNKAETTIERIERLMEAQIPPWSRSELARQAGVNRSLISNILNGNKVPTARTLERIAMAFGVRVEYLRGITDNPAPTISGEELPEFVLEVITSMLKMDRSLRYEMAVIAQSFVAESERIEGMKIDEFIKLALDYAEEERGEAATDQVMAFLTELQQKIKSRGLIAREEQEG